MAVLVILFLLALGAASLAGRTADSHDPDYTLAPLIGRRPRP